MNRRCRFVFALALCVSLTVSSPIVAQQQALDPNQVLPVDPQVTVGTLDNGLTYYVRVNQRPENRAELRLIVKAGSVLEDQDQLGLAHFLEHMAFNGTEHFEKQELFDYMESVGMQTGAHTNAYTSFDETVYMLRVPTDTATVVETAFQVLEDWAHMIVLDSVEVEKERGVVIEEWRLGRGAQARMLDEQFPILFSNSRYSERLPIGTRESVETFEHESLRRFYADWYRPDLMAIVAVGDFDKDRIVELIEQHFSGLETAANARAREMFDVPDHEEMLFAIAADAEAPNTTVGLYHKQPLRDQSTLGAYRQMLVEGLYNSMLNARLFELTQQAEAPFLFAFSGQGRFIGATEVYQLFAGVNEDGIAIGTEALLREGERVARHGFTPTELARHKIEYLRGLEQAYAERENRESRTYASEYIRAFLEGEPIPGIETEFAISQALMPTIELGDVNRLAAEWITERNRVVMVNAPIKPNLQTPTAEQLRSVMAGVMDTEIAPYVDAVSDEPLVAEEPTPADIVAEEFIEELNVTAWTLANGVRVLLKPTDYKDDEILFRSYSPGGTSLAADENYVSALSASDVVGQGGVGAFNLIDLQKVLAGKAVNVSPSISSLYESISGSASPDDIETMFQLIHLYFTEPRKDSTAFLAFRSQLQGFLANRSASPQAAFSDTVQVTMAQGHFRARPISAELFDEVDLNASFDFYLDRFADASDFTFVFVGAFALDSIRPLVQTYIGGLPSIDREENWRDVGIDPPAGVIRKSVHKGVEPQSQTQIIFTGPFDYTAENRQIIRSLASTLQTKLREVLREELGGTYGVGVSASYEKFPDEGYGLRITFGSAPERVEELTEVVFREIESFKNPGPDPEHVNNVREIQRRARETSLRENGFWVAQLTFADQYGTDPRVLISYDLIDALTAEKVREAAVRYLRTDNYVLVSLFPETPVP
jgi:zinc protease